MKHAVIVAHPNPDSFNLAVARAYVDEARLRKHEVVLRDLYRMDFDPRLRAGEIPGQGGFTPAPDVVAEREAIKDAEVFVFVYPLWFYAPPAMLKGYIERVLGMGFGFGGSRAAATRPSCATERWSPLAPAVHLWNGSSRRAPGPPFASCSTSTCRKCAV